MHTQEELLRYFAAYLPYNVMVYQPSAEIVKTFTLDCEGLCFMESQGFEKFKLVLKPLSDYEDITGRPVIDLNTDLSVMVELSNIALKRDIFGNSSYMFMEFCFHNHIDIFNLIPKGIAVSIRDFKTLNQK